MSTIEFESDAIAHKRVKDTESSFVTKLFMTLSCGLITTQKQAAVAQIVFVLLALCFLLFFFSGNSKTTPQPTQEQVDAVQPTRPL